MNAGVQLVLHDKNPVEVVVALLSSLPRKGVVVCASVPSPHLQSMLAPHSNVERLFFVDCCSKRLGTPLHAELNGVYTDILSEVAMVAERAPGAFVVVDDLLSLLQQHSGDDVAHLLETLKVAQSRPVFVLANQSGLSPEFLDQAHELFDSVITEHP
ncbi:hypothetical protein HY490_03140 [Candidatus Woesearchaeota archaeon]|nr:hypothetical protein [Candidatus Woesearchaeota archaeon]